MKINLSRREHLLVILTEECNEVAQRCAKALRFGLDEIQEGQDLDNAERIIYELNDLLAVVEMLTNEGYLKNNSNNYAAKELKKDKVEKYLKYSELIQGDFR